MYSLKNSNENPYLNIVSYLFVKFDGFDKMKVWYS
jgi:hypothetical protein